jgi:hypothetical protein
MTEDKNQKQHVIINIGINIVGNVFNDNSRLVIQNDEKKTAQSGDRREAQAGDQRDVADVECVEEAEEQDGDGALEAHLVRLAVFCIGDHFAEFKKELMACSTSRRVYSFLGEAVETRGFLPLEALIDADFTMALYGVLCHVLSGKGAPQRKSFRRSIKQLYDSIAVKKSKL